MCTFGYLFDVLHFFKSCQLCIEIGCWLSYSLVSDIVAYKLSPMLHVLIVYMHWEYTSNYGPFCSRKQLVLTLHLILGSHRAS